MHSNSIIAYLVWVGVRDAEPHCMRDHFSPGSGWSSANQFQKSLDASVINIDVRLGLNGWTVVVVVGSNFTRSNSLCMSSVQTHAIPFLRRGRRAAIICARSGTNAVNLLTKPRNDRSCDTLVGVGRSAMAWYLLSSGLIPAWLIICPAKVISFPNSNFLREIVMFRSRQRSRMIHVLS